MTGNAEVIPVQKSRSRKLRLSPSDMRSVWRFRWGPHQREANATTIRREGFPAAGVRQGTLTRYPEKLKEQIPKSLALLAVPVTTTLLLALT
jgi:hypothetical protein